jgi:hypothetical protein
LALNKYLHLSFLICKIRSIINYTDYHKDLWNEIYVKLVYPKNITGIQLPVNHPPPVISPILAILIMP